MNVNNKIKIVGRPSALDYLADVHIYTFNISRETTLKFIQFRRISAIVDKSLVTCQITK